MFRSLCAWADRMWKKAHTVSIPEDRLFYILLAVFIVGLLPMLILAKYNVPSWDDYACSVYSVHAWRQTHSLAAVLRACLTETVEGYYAWQGTFSAVFLFSLQPALFGERWYFLTTYVMTASLLGGTFYFIYVVFHHLLGATKAQAGIVGIVLGAAFTQLLPNAVEGFYWWVGAVYYTFFFGIALLLYGKLLLLLWGPEEPGRKGRQLRRLLEVCILSVLIGGANYPTALLTAVLYVLALCVAFGKKRARGITVPCLLFLAAFVVNVLAPGNGVRQDRYDSPSVIWSIKSSFSYAWQYAGQWFSALLVCLLIVLIPIFWQLVQKQAWDFRWPQWFALGTFCLYSALLCPIFYATHNPPPARYADLVYYAYVLFLTANLFYFLGWLNRKWKAVSGKAAAGQPTGYPLHYLIGTAVAFAVTFLIVRDSTYITSDRAIRDFHTGEAAAYYAAAQERLPLLWDETQKNVVLQPFPVFPYNLFNGDIVDDPHDWRNEGMERYYDKETIVLAPGEQPGRPEDR